MLFYDRRLTGPSFEELSATLADAADPTRWLFERGTHLRPDVADWVEACAFAHEREGVMTAPSPGRHERRGAFAVAWWTDAHSRRTWRVLACNPGGADGPRWPVDRPALWWVFPDRLFTRHDTDSERLLAACVCGHVGEPADLAWTGPTCGPCDDHRQEREAANLPGPNWPPARITASGVRHLAFSPCGRWLAAGGPDQRLTVWETATGRQAWCFEGAACMRFAFAADGILTVGSDGRLVRRDPATGRAVALADDIRPLGGVKLLLDGDRLLVNDVAPLTASRLRVFALASRKWVAERPLRGPKCLVGAADGRAFVSDSRELTAFDDRLRDLWSIRWGSVVSSRRWAAGDGRLLVVGDGSVEVRNAATGAILPTHLMPGVSAAGWPAGVVWPAGAETAAIVWVSGRAEAWAMRGEVRRRSAWSWHPGGVAAMALSADGRMLATAGAEGYVKLWPWAELTADEVPG